MKKLYRNTINTSVGFIEITTDDTSLISVSFREQENKSTEIQPLILTEAVQQINEYFEGNRKEFNLRINPSGTDFQKKVWNLVENIPFGETANYHDIAIQTGSSNNSRAVGLANGKNPIPIIIPCHRVIGKDGRLVGYSGGLKIKKWLLIHELEFSKRADQLF